MTLSEYLAASVDRAWIWGEHDCTAWPARWAGIELPAYRSEDEARDMVAAAGSLVELWDVYAPDRAVAVTEYAPGDVGVIEIAIRPKPTPFVSVGSEELAQRKPKEVPDIEIMQVGAIYTGKRWTFVPHGGGIAAVSTHPLKAWRVGCRLP